MIYVDEPEHFYRGEYYCHLFTDGKVEELHDFAARLNLKKAWFQNPKPAWWPREEEIGDHPHYDVSPSKRRAALRMGAQFKPGKEWLRDIVHPRRAAVMEVYQV